jgi:hypothetical protein
MTDIKGPAVDPEARFELSPEVKAESVATGVLRAEDESNPPKRG